jgi:hypothetical protein
LGVSDVREDALGKPDGAGQRRPAGHQARGARSPLSDGREGSERAAEERENTEERELTEDERLELFRDSLQQSVLPDLPHVPGYHVFWATRSNPRDSIQWRLRLGYRLIRVEECPGFESMAITSGDYAGVIAVNEMLAMRIPLSLYNKYMREVHHLMPMQEEEKVRHRVEAVKADARTRGTTVDEGDGMADIVQRARAMPAFSE